MDFSERNFSTEIFNAVIQDISPRRDTALVTVSYEDCIDCRRREQTVTLVVNERTMITNMRGNMVPLSDLEIGTVINATISSAMTRSIPPQAQAFSIQIVRNAAPADITSGRIISRDRENHFLTVLSTGGRSSVIRFFVPFDTPIFNSSGRRISFSMLVPGMNVRIRHTTFMTASIPPQTTALEIRVL